jgi:hypothetical protein
MAIMKTESTPYKMKLNRIDILDPSGVDFPARIEASSTNPKEAFHVDYLKKQFSKIQDLARPNQFKVEIIPPPDLMKDWNMHDLDLMVLAKSTKIPAITVKEYVYQRAGQKLYIPTGEVIHGDASITFYNDANFNLRTLFNRWIRLGLHNWIYNIGAIPSVALGGEVRVYHYNYKWEPVSEISLMNCWPKQISEIVLSQDEENKAEEFTVDFNYSYQEFFKP